MDTSYTRRKFMGTLGAAMILPAIVQQPPERRPEQHTGLPHPPTANMFDFRIRTITAGVPMTSGNDLTALEKAADFLEAARTHYTDLGYEVQTIRISTQPLREYMDDWRSEDGLRKLETIDAFAAGRGIMFNIGPLVTGDDYDPDLARWAAEMNRRTSNISCTVHVASAAGGIHWKTAHTAAEIITALARNSASGEGNFRFAATAYCPPGTPFFPAAYHNGEASFAIGLETPRLLEAAFRESSDMDAAQLKLRDVLNDATRPIAENAAEISRETGRSYIGIDVSPAPGLDASIGAAIETLTGAPFGSMSTLSACAAITDVLKSLDVQICGYSGLMLPVLEDPVLAKRADEGRYGVSELLLYSTVCGTGLDVIPLPGDTSVDSIRRLITDVASLSNKYQKPLSARLFPVPGLKAGDHATFTNSFLTDSMIMKLDGE